MRPSPALTSSFVMPWKIHCSSAVSSASEARPHQATSDLGRSVPLSPARNVQSEQRMRIAYEAGGNEEV
jgi:hypothetical protein